MKLKELLDITQFGKQVSVNDNMAVHIETVTVTPYYEFTRAWVGITKYLDCDLGLISTTPNNQLYVELTEEK